MYSVNWDGAIAIDELRNRLGNDIWANTPNSISIHPPAGVEYQQILADVVDRMADITSQVVSEGSPR